VYIPKIYFRNNAILVLMNKLRDKSTLEHFGARLKELRLNKWMTLEQPAFEADNDLSQVYMTKKGKKIPL
jgi:hypothetical protein